MEISWKSRCKVLTRESLRYFFVHYDVHFHATLSGSLQHAVNAVLLILRRWSP